MYIRKFSTEDKMSILQSVLVLIFLLQKGVLGFVDMTCAPTDIALNEASTCTCTTDSGTGIAWQKDGTNLMLCYTGGACDASFPEYDNGYSTSGTNKVFTITIKAFGYSDCSVFTCKDQASTDSDQQTLTLHEFIGGTPSIKSEPGSNTNGSIEITTGCVFKGGDIKVNWYSVDSTNENETYTPDTLFKTQTTCSDATKVCNGENAVTLNTGFMHTEKTGECVKLRVEVFHSADPSNKLEWTTTGEYCIGGDCTCECKCKCKKMVIASIVFGSLGAINLPVVIGGTVTENFGKTTALVVDVIGIVCDVISSVLGIVVEAGDCCEDDADCCEDDSDCCEVECERNWIENTGAAFIAIGALVGIVAGAIFYLIWSNRMGPGNNAYKAKEAKDPGENHGMTGTSM